MRRTSVFALSLVLLVTVALADKVEGGPGIGTPPGTDEMNSPVKTPSDMPAASSPGAASPPPLNVAPPAPASDGNAVVADQLANQLKDISHHVKQVSGELAKTSSQIENVRDSSLRNDFADSIKKAALLRKVGANPKDFASWKQRHFPKHNITEAEALANEEQQANKLVKEDKELAAIMENAKKHPQQVEPVLPVVTGSLTKGLNEIAKTVNGYKSNVEQLNHNLESAIQAEKRKAAKEQTVEEIRNQLTSDTGDISQLKLRIAHLNDLEKLHSKTLKTKLASLSKEHKQKFKKLVYASRLKALNAWLKQKRRQRLLKMIHQLKVNKVYQRQQRLAQSLISKNAADLWKTFVNTVNKHKSLRDQQNHVLEEVETLHQKTMKKLKAVHLKEKHRIRSQIQKRYSELIKKHFATLKNLRKQRELLAKQLSARQQLVAQREKKLERVLKDEEAPASKDFPKVEDKQAEEQQKKLYRLIHKNRRFKALVEKLVRRQDQISGRKGKYWQTLRERIRKHVRALTERIEKNTQVIQTLSAAAQAHHKHQEREKMLEAKVQRLQHELEALRNKKDAPAESKAAASTKKAAAAAKTTDLLPPSFSPQQVKHSLRRHRATLKRLAHRSKKLYMHIRRGERRMRRLQAQLEEALNAYLKRKLRYQITRLRRRLRRLKHRLMLNIGQFLKTREDLLEKKKQYILRGEIKIKESIETVDPGKRRVLIIALAKMSRGVKYIDTQEAKLDRARRNLVHRTYRAILKALRRRRAHIKEKLEALKEKKDVSQGLAEERVQRQIERLENKLDDVSSKLSRVENTARIHMLVLKREVLRRKARELRRLIRAAANEDVLKNHEHKLEKVNARQEKLKHKIYKARRVVITALNGDLQVLRKRKDHNVALISQLREHVAAAKGDEYKRQIRRLKRLQRKVFNIQRRIMMTEHKIEIITRMVANEDQVEDATPGWHKLTDDKPKTKHETLQKYNPPPPPPPSERPVSWFHSEKHIPPETYKPVVSTSPPNFANNNNNNAAAAPAAAASAPAPAAAPTPAPTPAPQHATAAARPVPQTHNAPAAPPATPLTPPPGLPKPAPTNPAANPAAELGQKAQRQPRKVLMMCLKIMEEEKQAILNQKNGVVNTTPAPPGPSPQQLQHAADAARAALAANSKPAFVEVDETETEAQGAMVQLDEAMFDEDAVQTEAGRYCQDVVKSYQTWRLHNVCHESVPCSMKVPKNMVDFQDSRPKVPYGVNLDVPKPVPAPQVKTWNYAQGGADWNIGLCKTGRMQSPIRLDEGAANFTTNQHEGRGNKYQLRFSYQPAMNLTIHHHDGYAISVRPSVAGTLGYVRSGCCDDTKYRVESLHFHAKGEHVFGGRNSADQGHYPMEMHIVHRKEGTTGTDGILIVVVPFERKHTPGSNKFLDAVDFNDLPHSIGGSRVITNVLDLNELSYSLSGDYFAYQGSLTTPGCDENIEYRVLSQPQGMSQGQIDAITSLFKNLTEFPGYHGNYREVQPRNGREIVFFKAHVLDGNNSAYRHRKMQWFRTELPSSNSYFVPPK